MRAIVEAHPQGSETWTTGLLLGDFRDDGDYRLLCRSLIDDLVVLANDRDLADAMKVIRSSSLRTQTRTTLVEALRRAPVARPDCLAQADVVVGIETGESEVAIDALSRCQALETVLLHMRRPIARGESRDTVFDRRIAPLARTAQKVFVYDPYVASSALSERSDSARWLLGRLLREGVPEIEFLSSTTSDDDTVVDRMRNWVAGRRRSQICRLVLTSQSQQQHDRHLRFTYGPEKRGIAISLGRGVDSFQSTMTGTEAMTIEDAWTAREREQAVRQFAQSTVVLEQP